MTFGDCSVHFYALFCQPFSQQLYIGKGGVCQELPGNWRDGSMIDLCAGMLCGDFCSESILNYLKNISSKNMCTLISLWTISDLQTVFFCCSKPCDEILLVCYQNEYLRLITFCIDTVESQ